MLWNRLELRYAHSDSAHVVLSCVVGTVCVAASDSGVRADSVQILLLFDVTAQPVL